MLKRLNESPHFKVAEGFTDIRGWCLVDSSGAEFGRIADLMFDPDDNEARYAVVADPDGRLVLVPVGLLDIDERRGLVRSSVINAAELADLKTYHGRPLGAHEELEHFRSAVPAHPAGQPIDYSHPAFKPRASRFHRLRQHLEEPVFSASEPSERDWPAPPPEGR